MSHPISAIVTIADTPDQAKLFVACLKAADIPAFTDGSPPDEFAMSQQLLNLTSTKVMVPHDALQRAKEVLEEAFPERAPVDLEELTRQALAAEQPETPSDDSDRSSD